MPKLTPASIERRRARIVGAALQSIFTHGFAGTSVDAVCAEAGISKGAFYSHFPTKESLIHAVMVAVSSELAPIGGESIDELADSIFRGQISPALPPPNARFGLEMMVESITDPVLRQRHLANLERLRSGTEAAIRHLVAAGAARPDCDPAHAATIIETFVLGTLSKHALTEGDHAAKIRDALGHLLGSLLAPRSN